MRASKSLVTALASAACLAAPSVLAEAGTGEGLRLFDFGTARSSVWAGFTRVTPASAYSEEQGWGWADTSKLRGLTSGGRRHGGAPDALMGDYIHSNGLDFVLDLPVDTYRVVAYVDGYQLHGRMRFRGYSIGANGEQVASFGWTHKQFLSTDYFFRDWDREFDPAEPVWDRWEPTLHRTEVFTVEPVEGKVRLRFSHSMQVFGLIVYPVSKDPLAKRAIAQLDERRRDEFYTTYFPQRIPAPAPLPDLTPAEEARGYVVFSRHVFDEVDYHDAPAREEIGRSLEMVAAREEFETVAFTVLPLVDVPRIAVSVGALTGDGGTIPASTMKLERLRYRWQPVGPDVIPKGLILTPRTERDGPARVNQRFLLTLKAPATAKGLYRGIVRIDVDGRPATELPLKVRALPFSLPSISETGLSAGYYYYSPRSQLYFDRMNATDSPEAGRVMERDLRLMMDFNLNAFQLDYLAARIKDYDKLAAGDPSAIDFSLMNRDLALCRKVGFDGVGLAFFQSVHNGLVGKGFEFGSEDYAVRAQNFFRLFGENVRSQGGPEIVAWLTDEVRETGLDSWNLNHDDALRYCEIVRQGVGDALRTTLTLMADRGGAKDYTDLVPASDVTQTHFWDKSDKIIRTAREGGHELWSYNSGRSRYSWGLQVYRLNGKGRWQWHYYTHTAPPYNPCFRASYMAVFYTPDGHFTTPNLVESREGLDDYRYVWMLEQTLKQGGPAAARKLAEEALSDIRDLPPYGIKLAGGAAVGGGATEIFPSSADYDRLRWRVAQAILALRGE